MKKGKLAMVPPRPATKVTPGRIGKKGILTQLDQDTARRLKMLAVERDTTLQALGEEAFNELLQRYDRSKGGPEPMSPRTAEELLLDMGREAEDPWRYYQYHRKPRKIMLPIRVTEWERDAIRAAAKFENKKVSEFIRAAIADRAAAGFCKDGAKERAS